MISIHYLQHVPFEDPGYILTWASERGYSISGTRPDTGEHAPSPSSFDWLVIMGGPMSVGEEDRYSWLKEEKRFIREAIDAGKTVLGVCLGAQLIADVLGGRVYRNTHPEIGWHTVRLTPEGMESPVFGILPAEFTAFHWHGDTFTLPPHGIRTVESDACPQQAFEYRDRVFGLQFHLETTAESLRALLVNCAADLKMGPFVQSAEEILSREDRVRGLNTYAAALLDRIGKTVDHE